MSTWGHGAATGLVVAAFAVSSPAAAQTEERPKVGVVVAGDPEPQLRRQADQAHRLVRERPDLRAVEDPGLARALRGETADGEEDGLERARTERRRLGWDEAEDVPVLVRIGRMTGAHLLLVVRATAEGAELVGFHTQAGAFFEGALALPEQDEGLSRFVRARARAALLEAEAPEPVPSPSTDPAKTGSATAGSATADSGAQPADEGEGEEEKTWIQRYWPYLLGGALLAGTVTFFLVRDANDDPASPVLRFRIGGDR